MKNDNAATNGNNRRSFLKGTLAAAAGATALGAPNLLGQSRNKLTKWRCRDS
jgi:hypothetical protein